MTQHKTSSTILRQQQVVRVKSEKGSVSFLKLTPAMLLFMAIAFQLFIRISILEHGYEIAKVREQALNNDTNLREARGDYAALARPQRLYARASTELGFKPSHPSFVRVVNDQS